MPRRPRGGFLLPALALAPRGEFPLTGDWPFVRSTRFPVATHDRLPLGWASMTQISHALFGPAVCSIVSCPFEHLRSATPLAGLAPCLATFAPHRGVGSTRLTGVLAASAVVFDPVLHPFMFAFMTDVAS